MLASFPDLVISTDLAQVNGFEEPVVHMTGTASETADEVEDILVVNSFGFKLIDELFFGYSAAEESSKGTFKGLDTFFTEIGEAQPDLVYAADLAGVSACHDRERRDISGDSGDPADIAIAPKGDKGMRADNATEPGVGLQMVVPSQVGTIDYQTVVAYIAVVGNMSVNHEQAIASDACFVAEFMRTGVYGGTFAKGITICDTDFAYTIDISEVLRRTANNDVGEELIIGSNDDVTGNGYVIVQPTIGANANLGADDTEGADESIVGNFGGWINSSKGAYF